MEELEQYLNDQIGNSELVSEIMKRVWCIVDEAIGDSGGC